MSHISIDRDLPIPAYYQIEQDLKDRIAREEWAVEQQMASENVLCQEYGVSRVTVRQALAELEKDGIIHKERGRGAFISANPVPFVHSLNYAVASADRLGNKPYNITATTLRMQLYEAPYPDVIRQLGLTKNTCVVYFKRLFLLEDHPIAIGRSWISKQLVPDLHKLGLIDHQLSTTLRQRYHLTIDHIDDCLEVVRSTPGDCQLLKVSFDTPLLLVKGVSYLADNTPVEYSNTLWLGDRVRFRLHLKNTDQGYEIV